MNLQPYRHLLALVLTLFALSACASAQGCLPYETDGVRLTGTITKMTFPGPPNYESIRKGDTPETSWVLHLRKPICTTASTDNDAEKSVTDLQLILTARQYTIYKKFVGRKTSVTITGKLTHAMTGHHHTPVLMDVTRIK